MLENKAPWSKIVFFFSYIFFLISKNDIYMKGYSMQEEQRAKPENTRRRKQRKNKKRKKTKNILITERES